jgi:hypothetical protein
VKVTFIGGFKSRNFVTKQVEEGKWDLKFAAISADELTGEEIESVYYVKYAPAKAPSWKKDYIEAMEKDSPQTLKVNSYKNKFGKTITNWDVVCGGSKKSEPMKDEWFSEKEINL